jgi:hypothetical protein
MRLTCNINRRGRWARLLYGIGVLGLGISLMLLWAVGTGSLLRWTMSCAVLLAGAFAIFEASVGWCVVRALGFRTPL